MMRFLAEKATLEFTLDHLVHLYQPFNHRGLLTLRCCSSTPLVVDDVDDGDQEWASWLIPVRTTDTIYVEFLLFPEG